MTASAQPAAGIGVLSNALRRWATKGSLVAAILVVWAIFGTTETLRSLSVPGLMETVATLADLALSANFWSSIASTLHVWILSLAVGGLAGIALGISCGLSSLIERSLLLPVEFFKTVPVIAVLPLGILVMGTGLWMRVVLVSFAVTWPLLVQTVYGVKSIDPVLRDSARSMGVGRARLFAQIVLPSAAPFIVTGLRIAAAMALIITIVIEFVVGGDGLGASIFTASISGGDAVPRMYALIVTAGMLGVVIAAALSMIERRLLGWHETHRPEAHA